MVNLFIIVLLGCFIAGVVSGIRQSLPPPRDAQRSTAARPESTIVHDTCIDERREMLDEALVNYNKLLKCLENAIESEEDPKKRMILLQKRIKAFESLTKTLEKREKLDT